MTGAIQFKMKKAKGLCPAGSCVITRLNAAPALSAVLNLQPVQEVCCREPHPMKEYRLFVIGSVTTECTWQQMLNRKEKTALGGLKCHVNSWVQPLNTSGVLSTPFHAFKGQGFIQTGSAATLPDHEGHHNFQQHLEGEMNWRK